MHRCHRHPRSSNVPTGGRAGGCSTSGATVRERAVGRRPAGGLHAVFSSTFSFSGGSDSEIQFVWASPQCHSASPHQRQSGEVGSYSVRRTSGGHIQGPPRRDVQRLLACRQTTGKMHSRCGTQLGDVPSRSVRLTRRRGSAQSLRSRRSDPPRPNRPLQFSLDPEWRSPQGALPQC
jgi:hypothetical protein